MEPRRLLTADWHNPVNGLDVTADGQVGLRDALAVVREIHHRGERSLPARPATSMEPYWDANGDGRLSLHDASAVIRGSHESRGEDTETQTPDCRITCWRGGEHTSHQWSEWIDEVAAALHRIFKPDSPTAEHYDIQVPMGDVHFDPLSEGDKKIPMTRAEYDETTGTSLENPRQHPNQITSFLDGSIVYGSDFQRAMALRRHDGSGKLKTSDGNLLPLNDVDTFPLGTLANENATPRDPETLFAAGDVRANENPALASLHTLFVREHNRRVDELAVEDPTLTGEALYQQARAWVGALLQNITYSEFLPLLLGEDALPAYSGYDASVDPSISAMFSGAAFRFGHSLAIPEMELLDGNDDPVSDSPLSLRDTFFNPDPVKEYGVEPILRGMASQVVAALDAQVIDDLRNFLFGPPGAGGLDLVSLNIQRGRDLGLPSYNDARRELGLPAVQTFADVSSDAGVQARLSSVYANVEALDLWVAGLAEDHTANAMVGETFFHILRDQFRRLRDGDRFWFENAQFEAVELAAIRATTLQSVILRNTDITTLPESVFTTQASPQGFAAGGESASTPTFQFRSYDGHCNNLEHPALGQTGTHLLQDYGVAYDDGMSTPAGATRPNAREISNAVFSQVSTAPNDTGVTHMFMIWGQLLAHDTNFSPGGKSEPTAHAGGGEDAATSDTEPDATESAVPFETLASLFRCLAGDTHFAADAASARDAWRDALADHREEAMQFVRVAERMLDRAGVTVDDFFHVAESLLARRVDQAILDFVDDLEDVVQDIRTPLA